jgi:hypothetical protein
VVDIQQLLDRMLADTTPTRSARRGARRRTRTRRRSRWIRARLLQIREQLDALLAGLNRR